MSALYGTASITIGINAWFTPQISEHWPAYTPGYFTFTDHAFLRPGTASSFTPNEGIANAWRTSAEVTKIWITEFVGIIARLVTSRRWFTPIFGDESVIGREYVDVIGIDRSKSLIRLGISYSQYHWWASAFNVNSGFHVSSWRYRSRKDGIASVISIRAGRIVQRVSKCWCSVK